ncbi:MAG: hypothetical protein IT384_08475 [Deltaproteobacteria bacterium]|nr:hypothetical protein [Deltaproteobacteria bacterium]
MALSLLSRVERGVREGKTHLRKVESAVKTSANELGPLMLALLLISPVVAAALFYVWAHVATVRLGFALSESGEVHRTLLEENRALRIEVATLKAPERLKQLGMEYRLAPPVSSQIIRVRKGQP